MQQDCRVDVRLLVWCKAVGDTLAGPVIATAIWGSAADCIELEATAHCQEKAGIDVGSQTERASCCRPSSAPAIGDSARHSTLLVMAGLGLLAQVDISHYVLLQTVQHRPHCRSLTVFVVLVQHLRLSMSQVRTGLEGRIRSGHVAHSLGKT